MLGVYTCGSSITFLGASGRKRLEIPEAHVMTPLSFLCSVGSYYTEAKHCSGVNPE